MKPKHFEIEKEGLIFTYDQSHSTGSITCFDGNELKTIHKGDFLTLTQFLRKVYDYLGNGE